MSKIKLNKHIISNQSKEDFFDQSNGPYVAYLGIDPTAPGIHLGHLIPIQLALDLEKQGCRIIILVGGFTGSIGDPTGKSTVRKTLEDADISEYSSQILEDLKRVFSHKQVTFVNNKDWMDQLTLKEYLKIYGRHLSVARKLALETFKNRLESHCFLSASEFTYPDLQMIDWVFLYKKYGCNIQIGGGDQWGNISFGASYVKHITGQDKILGITTPLLTTNGQKVSKTTNKAPFLFEQEEFYHYCYNLPDDTIGQLEQIFQITGKENLIKYFFDLYGNDFETTRTNYRLKFSSQTPLDQLPIEQQLNSDKISIILKECGLTSSNSESRRKLAEGCVFVNQEKILEDIVLTIGKYKLTVGKKNHKVIYIEH